MGPIAAAPTSASAAVQAFMWVMTRWRSYSRHLHPRQPSLALTAQTVVRL